MLSDQKKKELEILTHFNSVYWEQFRYHREKEYRIFVWTSATLFAGIAGLLVTKEQEIPVYAQFGSWGYILATIAILLWLSASIWMQRRERKSSNQYVNVLVRIATELGAFEQKQSTCVLPKAWKKWSSESEVGYRFNFVPISILVGLLAILLVWAPWFGVISQ